MKRDLKIFSSVCKNNFNKTQHSVFFLFENLKHLGSAALNLIIPGVGSWLLLWGHPELISNASPALNYIYASIIYTMFFGLWTTILMIFEILKYGFVTQAQKTHQSE